MDTDSVEYTLEYGVDALEVHNDAFADGPRVLVHDDLLQPAERRAPSATWSSARAPRSAARSPSSWRS